MSLLPRRLTLARANKAVSLGIAALIVIALIIIVGFGVYLNAALYPTLNTTYTKATNITALSIPLPVFSAVCANTTSTQHSGSATVSTYTTVTCTAVVTVSRVTEYLIISQYGSENVTISGTCTIYAGGIAIFDTTSTSYMDSTSNTGNTNVTTITLSNSSFTIVTHTTTRSTTNTSYTCPSPLN